MNWSNFQKVKKLISSRHLKTRPVPIKLIFNDFSTIWEILIIRNKSQPNSTLKFPILLNHKSLIILWSTFINTNLHIWMKWYKMFLKTYRTMRFLKECFGKALPLQTITSEWQVGKLENRVTGCSPKGCSMFEDWCLQESFSRQMLSA